MLSPPDYVTEEFFETLIGSSALVNLSAPDVARYALVLWGVFQYIIS